MPMKNALQSRLLFYLLLASLPSACTSSSKLQTLKVSSDLSPVALRFSPQLNYSDVTQYKTRAITRSYLGGEIASKVQENSDFSVETKITGVDSERRLIDYSVRTLDKEGKLDLADFAMPEVGETIDFQITESGQVIKAGDFPPGTIYFLPPVSLPGKEVKIGDTWDMTASWVSAKSGIPLEMSIASILTNLRDCGTVGRCAEIDISGHVTIKGIPQNPIASKTLDNKEVSMRFRSQLKGKVILAASSGITLYSVVRSDEHLSGENQHVDISSCTISYVKEPKDHRVVTEGKLDCNPEGDLQPL